MSNNLSPEKKALAVSMLAEGNSIRAVERVTSIHRDTIMRLGVRVGAACSQILDAKMRNLNCKEIQVDEIWGFIGKKQKLATEQDQALGRGDVWTYISLDRESKLVPSFLVGKRDAYHTKAFMQDLSGRLQNRVQLTSDCLSSYADAVERAFGSDVDYAQIVKTFSVTNLAKDAAHRYSPAEVVKTEKKSIQGRPRIDRISTSHIEKQNHTVRMHVRRLTRLTNAFSKKLENFEAAIAMHFAYYNFCKRHIAVRMTPAQSAGVESSEWSVTELLEKCGEI